MRALMLTWEYPPHVIGGLGRHVVGLSRALADEGVDVTVVTAANEGPEEETDDGLKVVRVRFGEPPGLNFPQTVAQRNAALLQGVLTQLRTGWSPTIVHAHDWLTAFAARAVKHAFEIPLVASIHATEHGRNGGLFTDLQRHISDVEWWLGYEAWRVICCSEAMRDELQRVFQLPQDKIRVIPNGVPLPQETANKAKQAAIRRRFAADHQPLLFFVGRLVYEKGVDLFVRALSMLGDAYPDAVAVVAGRGPHEDELRRLAQQLGVENRVRFLGYISDDERNTLYLSADAAVFPSRYEPFGIVALEAMSHGLPVIAAAVGGLQEVIDHGATGLLFSPNSAESLAETIKAALDSASLRQSLSRRAYDLVVREYTWRAVAERTLTVYKETLDEAKNGVSRWSQDRRRQAFAPAPDALASWGGYR